MTDTQEQIPEWALEKARDIDLNLTVTAIRNDIARALVIAKAKGVKEERERCADAAVNAIKTAGDSAVTEALGTQLCCDGRHCGCRGYDVEHFLTTIVAAAIRKGF